MHVGQQNNNVEVLKKQIRSQFKKNMQEVDPQKIMQQKEGAVRALSNYVYYIANIMSKNKTNNLQ